MSRYLEIAQGLSVLMASGSLRPGDPLPSVRSAALQHHVGNGTVVHAYAVLESQGLIETRPRSGYYVRQKHDPSDIPNLGLQQPSLVDGDSRARLQCMLGDLMVSQTTLLGSSFVDPALFPLHALKKGLIASMKDPSLSVPVADSLLGLPRLRRAIANRYMEMGYTVPLDEIVITNGGMEAIYLALKATTKAGDVVLIDSPMFFGGLQLIQQLELTTIELPTHPTQGLDLGQLETALTKYKISACLLMTNCHNPLGFSLPEIKKMEMMRLLRKYDVPLVENDVYSELQYDFRHIRAAKAFDTSGLVLHCGSFSKCLAPGFKIGWVATGRHKEKVASLKFVTSLGTNVPTQAAIAHYLRYNSYDRHLRRLRTTLQSRVARMIQAVDLHFPVGTRYTRPGGGFVLWVQLPNSVDSLFLFDTAALSNIGIAPGPIFSASPGYQNYIRLNCSHEWTDSIEDTIRWLGGKISGLVGR